VTLEAQPGGVGIPYKAAGHSKLAESSSKLFGMFKQFFLNALRSCIINVLAAADCGMAPALKTRERKEIA
jgi:hypothetical protein